LRSSSIAQDGTLNFRLRQQLLRDFIGLFRGFREGRLVRHYFLALVVLITAALSVSGLLDVYFNYSENWEHFSLIQEQIATDRFTEEGEGATGGGGIPTFRQICAGHKDHPGAR